MFKGVVSECIDVFTKLHPGQNINELKQVIEAIYEKNSLKHLNTAFLEDIIYEVVHENKKK